MPINFNTLVKSENDLKKLFGNFYKHVIGTYEYLLQKLKSSQGINALAFMSMQKKEKKANAAGKGAAA